MFRHFAMGLQCQVTDEGSNWHLEGNVYDSRHNVGSSKISVEKQNQRSFLAKFGLHILVQVCLSHCLLFSVICSHGSD
jgi:hypothetical protein